MNSINLLSINDFEKKPSAFFSKFYQSIPKEFSKTQIEFIRTNRGKAVSPSYYKYYSNDFNEILVSRLDNLNKNRYFETLKNITASIDLLYKNISNIYVFCYNRNLNSFTNSITNYFNNTETINHFNSILCIDKYSSNQIDLNNTNIFILESLEYLKICINKNLFIHIDKTPLGLSYNKLMDSFEKNIDISIKRKKNKKRLTLKGFIHRIETEDLKDDFIKDLVKMFNEGKPSKFYMLINELINNSVIIIPDKGRKDLYIELNKHFSQVIGNESGFYAKVVYNFETNAQKNMYLKDINRNKNTHDFIVSKLKQIFPKYGIKYSPKVTSN